MLALEYESSFSLKHKKADLCEPSGLALSPDGSLWTVCDESKRLFCINRQGEIISKLEISSKGLEGITFDAAGRIWTIDENRTRIIIFDSLTGDEITSRKLKKMDGYELISDDFKGDKNKGLEGMAYDPVRSEMLLLKQASPGMLIAVSLDLDQISTIDVLSKCNGFTVDEMKSKHIHFSGMCYDASRDLFWIVSDKAKCVFLFDRRQGSVVQTLPLEKKKPGRCVKDAEGVAFDAERQQLYVVSDDKAKLYVFRVVDV